MRNRVEILRQVGVHHIGEPLAQQSVHRLDRIDAAAAWTVAISSGFEVRCGFQCKPPTDTDVMPPIVLN